MSAKEGYILLFTCVVAILVLAIVGRNYVRESTRVDLARILVRPYMIEADLSQEQGQACMDWAFGQDWETAMNWSERWNTRHGDLFRIQPSDPITTAIPRIVTAYLLTESQPYTKAGRELNRTNAGK